MSLTLLSFIKAEAEKIATKVQTLIAENMTLESELDDLMKSSEKLVLENGTLLVSVCLVFVSSLS